jgi:hypothetical protein
MFVAFNEKIRRVSPSSSSFAVYAEAPHKPWLRRRQPAAHCDQHGLLEATSLLSSEVALWQRLAAKPSQL